MSLRDIPHLEKMKDEIFLMNCTYNEFETKCAWNTKRLGCVAYDEDGKIIDQKEVWDYEKLLFPCFVKKHELIMTGIIFEKEEKK